jgi:hypothetical protein
VLSPADHGAALGHDPAAPDYPNMAGVGSICLKARGRQHFFLASFQHFNEC